MFKTRSRNKSNRPMPARWCERASQWSYILAYRFLESELRFYDLNSTIGRSAYKIYVKRNTGRYAKIHSSHKAITLKRNGKSKKRGKQFAGTTSEMRVKVQSRGYNAIKRVAEHHCGALFTLPSNTFAFSFYEHFLSSLQDYRSKHHNDTHMTLYLFYIYNVL